MTTSVVVTNGIGKIDKDPNAILDYVWDWSAWLLEVTDTIASVTFIVTGGVVVDSNAIIDISPDTANGVRAWISGGTLGVAASATCRIVTLAGRTEDRTLKFKLKER